VDSVLERAYIRGDYGLRTSQSHNGDGISRPDSAVRWKDFGMEFLIRLRIGILFLEPNEFVRFFPAYANLILTDECPKEIADEIVDMISSRIVDESGNTALSNWDSLCIRKKSVICRFLKHVAFSRSGKCLELQRIRLWLKRTRS
jgi:hypothetical protein